MKHIMGSFFLGVEMLSKTITYVGFNGDEREETVMFNILKVAIATIVTAGVYLALEHFIETE